MRSAPAPFFGYFGDFSPGCLAIAAVVPAHAFAAGPRRPLMTDPNSLRDGADEAYGFWNTAGARVSAHPKTTIAAALVVVALVIWLAF
jgi:hypothetical protein